MQNGTNLAAPTNITHTLEINTAQLQTLRSTLETTGYQILGLLPGATAETQQLKFSKVTTLALDSLTDETVGIRTMVEGMNGHYLGWEVSAPPVPVPQSAVSPQPASNTLAAAPEPNLPPAPVTTSVSNSVAVTEVVQSPPNSVAAATTAAVPEAQPTVPPPPPAPQTIPSTATPALMATQQSGRLINPLPQQQPSPTVPTDNA